MIKLNHSRNLSENLEKVTSLNIQSAVPNVQPALKVILTIFAVFSIIQRAQLLVNHV